jgi:hypothetical protein
MDSSTAQDRSDTITRIARRIAERAEAMGWKGKRGDAAAIECWAGACAGFREGRTHLTEDATWDHLVRVAFLNIARDPLKETLRLAERPTADEPLLPLDYVRRDAATEQGA